MKCYDKTGDKNPFHNKSHSLPSIQKMRASPTRPRFTKTNNPNTRYDEGYEHQSLTQRLRGKIRKERPSQCEVCGFDDIRALVYHHKDRNRRNNTDANPQLLCANCHTIEHYEKRDGIFSMKKRKPVAA